MAAHEGTATPCGTTGLARINAARRLLHPIKFFGSTKLEEAQQFRSSSHRLELTLGAFLVANVIHIGSQRRRDTMFLTCNTRNHL